MSNYNIHSIYNLYTIYVELKFQIKLNLKFWIFYEMYIIKSNEYEMHKI